MADMNAKVPVEDFALTESDIALIDVLQDEPRASWATIGRSLGVSPHTARRRWERLESNGTAWLTSYPAPASGVIAGLVAVSCKPGAAPVVASALIKLSKVVTACSVTGDRDLLLSVVAGDITEFQQVIQVAVGGHQGISSTRSALMTRVFHDGSNWRLSGTPHRRRISHSNSTGRGQSIAKPETHKILSILEHDGRASISKIARALGTSETHARRIMHGLASDEQIIQRVDVSLSQRHWPHAMVLWMVVSPARLEAVAQHISQLPATRTCAALAGGPSNLYAIVWLNALRDASTIEAQIVGNLDVRVIDRSIVLEYHKRLGHTFGEDRRRSGVVGWVE